MRLRIFIVLLLMGGLGYSQGLHPLIQQRIDKLNHETSFYQDTQIPAIVVGVAGIVLAGWALKDSVDRSTIVPYEFPVGDLLLAGLGGGLSTGVFWPIFSKDIKAVNDDVIEELLVFDAEVKRDSWNDIDIALVLNGKKKIVTGDSVTVLKLVKGKPQKVNNYGPNMPLQYVYPGYEFYYIRYGLVASRQDY